MTSLTSLAQATPTIEELVIDLASEPASLAPALGYEANAWSITQSIYDAFWEYDDAGNLLMIGAESLTWTDPLTSIAAGQPMYNYTDPQTPVSGATYEYRLAAQDCSPKLSTPVSSSITIP